jgi:hypothetical protein
LQKSQFAVVQATKTAPHRLCHAHVEISGVLILALNFGTTTIAASHNTITHRDHHIDYDNGVIEDAHVVHVLLKSCSEDAVRMRRIFAIVSDLCEEFDDYLEEVGGLGGSLGWKTAEYRRLETNCALLSNDDHITGEWSQSCICWLISNESRMHCNERSPIIADIKAYQPRRRSFERR